MEKLNDCCWSIMAFVAISFTIFTIRLLYVLYLTGKPSRTKSSQPLSTLVVLGSGGHTAEMMNLLSVLQMDRFAPRFYIAAATDNMSLQKARVFEDSLVHKNGVKGSSARFMQIYRSREVLCNGPGTCIPLCVLGIRWSSVFYVESIARVKRLCLSGLLLYNFPSFQSLQDGVMMRRFPCLKNLDLRDLLSLQSLSREDGRELLPCLTRFKYNQLPKVELAMSSFSERLERHAMLESFPEQGLEGLNCLQHLDLINCRRFSSLSEGLGRLFYLERLNRNGCPELVALPDGIKYLSLLQHLTISGKFTGFDARYSPRNPGCHRLIVMKDSPEESDFCPKLVALPESLRHAPALKELSISFYPNLASLPGWLGDLTSLLSLRIFDCPKLPSLPASFQSFTNLQNLGISECPELVKQCEKETGEGMTGTR
ncbi:hypothetical protein Patl1_10133 [Pistacia atlantica]|uniref:Uncharacterized protein n=1 Tax=Pistacia atlantica TaxID=434234 RepID=A0ACC1A675_9ROSI|nr:hypothetical protein Patl1_10133 [Pistacia atlantica]